MFETLRLRREMKHYEKYAKLNSKRKSKEPKTPVIGSIFESFDRIRRRSGFVK